MSELLIADKKVRPGGRTFVIAEIGVNHDGSVERALELVQHAARGGADAIKLQVFRAAALMHKSSSFAEYQRSRVAANDPIEMLRKYELSEAELRTVITAATKAGLVSLATPFSLSDVDTIDRLELPAVKIASPDLVNRPLLERVAQLRKPMFVSTGAANVEETARTVEWLCPWECDFALLHCVSSYPVPAADANLCWIGELIGRFNVPVGYSDHTDEPMAGALAVMAGACIVEKHLTYDKRASGPDHSASCNPVEFAAYVAAIRSAETLRGRFGKHVLPIEQDVRTVSRQSLVLTQSLLAGEIVTAEHLMVQRPGTGISAADVQKVIGRMAKTDLEAGTMLQWEMLAKATAVVAA